MSARAGEGSMDVAFLARHVLASRCVFSRQALTIEAEGFERRIFVQASTPGSEVVHEREHL